MLSNLKNKIRSMGENNRIVFSNIVGAFIIKGGALVISMFTLPAYIAFFNNEIVLGVWYTLLSIINWVLYFDFGIGNGLRNHLTNVLSLKDNYNRDEAKRYISSAYFSVGSISILLILVFSVLSFVVDWNTALNIAISEVSAKALKVAVLIVFIGIILQLLLRNINSILYAMQKSSVNNLLSLFTSIITLIMVLVVPSEDNNRNMIVMAIVHSIASILPLFIATIVVFGGKCKQISPSMKYVDKSHSLQVLSLGGRFLFAQIAYMVIMSTNELLITRLSGSQYVVEYQAYYKLFSLISTTFTLMLTPLWSAITKAIAEKQMSWVNSIYRKFMLIAGVFSIIELIVVVLVKPIIKIWLKDDFTTNISHLSAGMTALICCLMMFNSVLSSVSNGTGRLKTQVVCFVLGAVLKVPLSILCVDLCNSWNGVLAANIFCMGIYTIIQPITYRKELIIVKEKS